MARSGFGTGNYLIRASGLITAAPLSVSALVKVGTLATLQFAFQLQNSGSVDGRNEFSLYVSSTNTVRAATGNATTTASSETAGTIGDTTSFHQIGGAWASATSRVAYLDGVAATADTTNLVPSGINQTTIGVDKPSGGVSLPFTGAIAEVGLWNVALSAADMATLALGYTPLQVRPDALVAYWPLLGQNSPENNLLSNADAMSITGSLSAAAHAPVRLPR